jgi:hypothetical protein
MEGEKKLSVIGESGFPSDSSKETMEEFVARYRKRGSHKPKLLLYFVLSTLIYAGAIVLSLNHFDKNGIELFLIFPFVSGFISVFLYSLYTQTNVSDIVLLSVGPPICLLGIIVLFGKLSLFSIFISLCLISPTPLMGGAIGFIIGRGLSLIISENGYHFICYYTKTNH